MVNSIGNVSSSSNVSQTTSNDTSVSDDYGIADSDVSKLTSQEESNPGVKDNQEQVTIKYLIEMLWNKAAELFGRGNKNEG